MNEQELKQTLEDLANKKLKCDNINCYNIATDCIVVADGVECFCEQCADSELGVGKKVN